MGFGPARRKKKAIRQAPAGRLFGDDFETLGDLGEDDIGYFMSLGQDDDTRLANYVEQQLDPASIDDSALNARMAQYPASFSTLNQSLAAVFAERSCQSSYDTYMRPLREVEKAAFTRAVYSKRQLFELTVDFWHNHFNIYAALSARISSSWHSWDRDVIRAHAFGNFFEFLYASARHVAMLHYLDNYRSSIAFNENYAREVIELHTFGAEHYRGLDQPMMVEALETNPYTVLGDPELDNPALSGGLAISDPARLVPAYYVDNDVYEAAKTLTGWRYNNANTSGACGSAAFFTDPNHHTQGQKSVLGRGFLTHNPDLPADQDGRITLKMLAWHPATARHVARKLCQRLIADDPPESVVDAAAETFFENRLAPDQIARTLRTILLSSEFKDPGLWGSKSKRPFEAVVSAMRVAGCDHTFRQDDTTNPSSNTTDSFLGEYNRAGQQLFWWRSPDGYPDRRETWQGSNALVRIWRAIDWLTDRDAGNAQLRVLRIIDLTLANLQGNPSARQVVEFWLEWIMGFAPEHGWTGPPGTLIANAPTPLGEAALRFFTQTYVEGAPDRTPWGADEPAIPRSALENDSTEYRWNTRLRGLVALILWSPNFMQR
ncbi:DUF1800 domain-containing protein [Xanthomonadaceae bacterium JHOS43]|nr:DUF1800 domain-containing protein [Xanthomonadaceae bacterium JHOS43]